MSTQQYAEQVLTAQSDPMTLAPGKAPMNQTLRCLLTAASVLIGSCLLLACSPAGEEVQPGAAETPALTKVSFNMGWLPQGSMAGVIVAIDQGYYAESGLEVETVRGFGGIRTVNEIDQGMFDFGYGDPLAVILNHSKGGKTRMVGAINDRWPAGLCFVTERNQIATPADLSGLSVGGGQSSPMQVIVPAWLELNGVSKDSVQLMQLDPAIVVGSLVEGTIDAGECWLGNSLAIFQKRAADAGLTIGWIEYGDFNFDLYGNGIVTSEKTIAEQPERVRAFVGATYRGYAWARENPQAAADIMVKAFPVLDPAITLQQVQEISELISGPGELGFMDEAKVNNTIEFLSSAYGLDETLSADEIYTNEFLAPAATNGGH
jgi:NitT/TauT family transport system substrate-binding protein